MHHHGIDSLGTVRIATPGCSGPAEHSSMHALIAVRRSTYGEVNIRSRHNDDKVDDGRQFKADSATVEYSTTVYMDLFHLHGPRFVASLVKLRAVPHQCVLLSIDSDVICHGVICGVSPCVLVSCVLALWLVREGPM